VARIAHFLTTMRFAPVLALLLVACADNGPSPYDGDFPTSSSDDVLGGVPDNDSLPDDNKADAVYPAKLFLPEQSPVRNQGHRGVCSIFASTALVENLYIKAGMPDPDFSEQYMQWAVKNQLGDFPNTEGSSAQSNIRTVVNFGTVAETVWPYEISPWTAANDPACTGGNNLPTKCYTNGEPPAAAATAKKYKLPSVQFINTNSIKAHMTAKKTGVAVGMTFFFQSWNHRLSTLPISSELWAQGVVTYPNAKDKELSLAEHEGHAILIVGWDDDLEFPMRDEQGNEIKDAAGNTMKEKGFWIFKNSWDTYSFGAQNPYGAGYGFLSYKYVQEYGSAVTADIPVLEDQPPPPPPPDATHDYAASPNAAIPDASPAGASSTIDVPDTGKVATVKVTTDITHTYRGDLRVTLSHGTVSKVIFDGAGGSADDLKQAFEVPGFENGDLAGAWTLLVEDTAAQDTGTFNSWQLEVATH
jgi:Proprotein convertase P-domain/Papain family cysteine protease